MKIPNTKYQILNTRRGFTMLELMVSLGIIAILIGVFVVNYRGGSRNSELALAAQKMVSDMRLVQNSALGSTPYNGKVPAGGWGVHFNKLTGNNTVYTIFADVDGDMSYDSPSESNPAYGARTVRLPDYINISEILFNGTPKNSIDTVFIPPDPETMIWDGFGTTTNATIRLRHSVTGVTKNIFVNFFGLIEVQ
jgi:prepilin-type N-terminal cleavage/methylation domain-containing protein